MLADTVVGNAPGIVIDVLADVDGNMRAASVTVLECIRMLLLLEVSFLFGCEACSCWPTAIWNCRALQPRMPSYHV